MDAHSCSLAAIDLLSPSQHIMRVRHSCPRHLHQVRGPRRLVLAQSSSSCTSSRRLAASISAAPGPPRAHCPLSRTLGELHFDSPLPALVFALWFAVSTTPSSGRRHGREHRAPCAISSAPTAPTCSQLNVCSI